MPDNARILEAILDDDGKLSHLLLEQEDHGTLSVPVSLDPPSVRFFIEHPLAYSNPSSPEAVLLPDVLSSIVVMSTPMLLGAGGSVNLRSLISQAPESGSLELNSGQFMLINTAGTHGREVSVAVDLDLADAEQPVLNAGGATVIGTDVTLVGNTLRTTAGGIFVARAELYVRWNS